MADAKTSALTPKTTPVGADGIPVVEDLGGTPANVLVLLSNLHKALTEATSSVKGAMPATDKAKLDVLFTGVLSKTTTYTLTTSDWGKLVECSGTFTVTLPAVAGLASGDVGKWYYILNRGTGTVTVSAGTEGINVAGTDSLSLAPNQAVMIWVGALTDPVWLAEIKTTLALGNSKFPGTSTAGVATAFDLKSCFPFTYITDANDTVTLVWKTPFALTLDSVDAATIGGTASIKIQDDGADVTNFGTAVALTTTNTNTSVGDAIAAGSTIKMVISAASSLTGIQLSLNYTRTGN